MDRIVTVVRETVVFKPMKVVVVEEFPLIITSAGAVVVPDIGRILVLRLPLLKRVFVLGFRTDEEFASISSGDVSDVRLVESKMGPQSVSVLRDAGCTKAGVRKSLIKGG